MNFKTILLVILIGITNILSAQDNLSYSFNGLSYDFKPSYSTEQQNLLFKEETAISAKLVAKSYIPYSIVVTSPPIYVYSVYEWEVIKPVKGKLRAIHLVWHNNRKTDHINLKIGEIYTFNTIKADINKATKKYVIYNTLSNKDEYDIHKILANKQQEPQLEPIPDPDFERSATANRQPTPIYTQRRCNQPTYYTYPSTYYTYPYRSYGTNTYRTNNSYRCVGGSG